nr:unnamed protein product [Callosobruchus analis]
MYGEAIPFLARLKWGRQQVELVPASGPPNLSSGAHQLGSHPARAVLQVVMGDF